VGSRPAERESVTAATASPARAAATAWKRSSYEDHVMCYCPTCQTDGKLLKDRRLSRHGYIEQYGSAHCPGGLRPDDAGGDEVPMLRLHPADRGRVVA
jgi:hypothetical protein